MEFELFQLLFAGPHLGQALFLVLLLERRVVDLLFLTHNIVDYKIIQILVHSQLFLYSLPQ